MEAIVSALQKLDAHGIRYCLLRNYQFLLGGEVGSDVDVAVQEKDRGHVEDLLSESGFHKKNRREKKKHTFFRKFAGGRVVKVDVSWNGSEYNGLPTVDIGRLLANRRRLNGCWIPSEEDYFVQIVFHCALKKGTFRESYKRDVELLRTTVNEKEVRKHAAHLFGSAGVKAVDHALAGDLGPILRMKWQLVAANCLQRPRAVPEFASILCYENNVRNWIDRLRGRLRPSPVPMIVVTGPDGAGKSTLTTNAAARFEELGYDVHLAKLGLTNDSAVVMDVAKRVYNRVTGYDVEEVKRRERRGDKTLGSRDGFHKTVVHFVDIYLRLLKAKRSGADVVIADRFIHDVAIYDRAGPLRTTFEWFETDHVYPYLLTGDPDCLVERSEYTLDSLTELVDRYESLDFERIDATQTPEEVLDELFEKVFSNESLRQHL